MDATKHDGVSIPTRASSGEYAQPEISSVVCYQAQPCCSACTASSTICAPNPDLQQLAVLPSMASSTIRGPNSHLQLVA